MAATEPAIGRELSAFFTAENKKEIPRLAMSIEGLDKTGKTHLAIWTAPEPVAVISNDTGTQAVVAKARAAGRKIVSMDLVYAAPDPAVMKASEVDAAEHRAWIAEWKRLKEATAAIIRDKSIRTLVRDTETEVWHLAELAHFGKLRGNARQDLRTELNGAYTKMFWDLYKQRPDLNIILIHKSKKKYVKGSGQQADWDGSYEIDGFSKIGFMVDLSLITGWDKIRKDYYVELDPNKSTRFGLEWTGDSTRWYSRDEEANFVSLALKIFPETEQTPEIWGL